MPGALLGMEEIRTEEQLVHYLQEIQKRRLDTQINRVLQSIKTMAEIGCA